MAEVAAEGNKELGGEYVGESTEASAAERLGGKAFSFFFCAGAGRGIGESWEDARPGPLDSSLLILRDSVIRFLDYYQK